MSLTKTEGEDCWLHQVINYETKLQILSGSSGDDQTH